MHSEAHSTVTRRLDDSRVFFISFTSLTRFIKSSKPSINGKKLNCSENNIEIKELQKHKPHPAGLVAI